MHPTVAIGSKVFTLTLKKQAYFGVFSQGALYKMHFSTLLLLFVCKSSCVLDSLAGKLLVHLKFKYLLHPPTSSCLYSLSLHSGFKDIKCQCSKNITCQNLNELCENLFEMQAIFCWFVGEALWFSDTQIRRKWMFRNSLWLVKRSK